MGTVSLAGTEVLGTMNASITGNRKSSILESASVASSVVLNGEKVHEEKVIDGEAKVADKIPPSDGNENDVEHSTKVLPDEVAVEKPDFAATQQCTAEDLNSINAINENAEK